jgi:hypothetical protein
MALVVNHWIHVSPQWSGPNLLCHNAGMTLLAALIGGGLAIAGGLVGVFATDRRERNRWRRDAQLRVSTELLSSLQEVIRRMIHLAYLMEKPPQPTLTPPASAYHEASVSWNSSIYAALLVSSPKIANIVQGLDREVDRLLERAMEKPWSRLGFREERRSLGRLAANYLNASRAEVGWSSIPIETVWAWDETVDDCAVKDSE